MSIIKKEKVADFFLSEANPYSQKRSIKAAHVGFVFLVLVFCVLGLGTYFDAKSAKEQQASIAKKVAEDASEVSGASMAANATQSDYVGLKSSYQGMGGVSRGGGGSNRQLSASQIIKRGNSPYDALPIGTLVRVRLIGNVESADQQSPVIAVVTDNSLSPGGSEVIPRGAKVIGQGQIDAARERLQVSFSTLVFPEGEQYSFSGLAAMPDGSSGITGDFSSGKFKRYASQFVGNFIGGMANGLKDRESAGQMGLPLEPGSLKNGALNGIAQSSLDYAKSSSEEMGQAKPSMRLSAGQEFVIYLSREFGR